MTFFLFFRISQNASYHSESLSKLFSLSISFYPNSPCSIFFFLSCKKNSALQFCVVFCWLNNGNSIKAPFGKINFYSSSNYMKLIDSSVKKACSLLSLLFLILNFVQWLPFHYLRKGTDVVGKDFKSYIVKLQPSLIQFLYIFYLILSHFSNTWHK